MTAAELHSLLNYIPQHLLEKMTLLGPTDTEFGILFGCRFNTDELVDALPRELPGNITVEILEVNQYSQYWQRYKYLIFIWQ